MFHGGPGHALRREVEHATDFRHTLTRLLSYLRPFAGQLLAVSLLVSGTAMGRRLGELFRVSG